VQSLMANHLNGKRTILDVGSGSGSMIPMLQTFGDVTMLEPDTQMVQKLRNEFKLPIIHGTLENKQVGSYDIVTLFDVLEHIEDDNATLRRIHDILNEDGYVILTVPAYQFLWSKHDTEYHHKRRYTVPMLRERVEKAGFSIERITYFNTFLFPPALMVRLLQKVFKTNASDFNVGSFLNRIFTIVFSAERVALRLFNFPFGLSIFCIASRKRDTVNTD